MDSPEGFLRKFFAARNALFRRHQKELETFQKEFCHGPLIYDKRLVDHEQEEVLEVVINGSTAEVTTNGNIKGRNSARLRYELKAADGAWLISGLGIECLICRGSGKSTCSGSTCSSQDGSAERSPDVCKVCKGLGWISTRKGVEGLLDT